MNPNKILNFLINRSEALIDNIIGKIILGFGSSTIVLWIFNRDIFNIIINFILKHWWIIAIVLIILVIIRYIRYRMRVDTRDYYWRKSVLQTPLKLIDLIPDLNNSGLLWELKFPDKSDILNWGKEFNCDYYIVMEARCPNCKTQVDETDALLFYIYNCEICGTKKYKWNSKSKTQRRSRLSIKNSCEEKGNNRKV